MHPVIFLTPESGNMLHAQSLARYGGCDGIRNSGLIDSAIASAQNTYLYGENDPFDTAATYAFHLAVSQIYLDGNKRTVISMAIAFLHANQIYLRPDEDALYEAMIKIANKQLDKNDLAELFRRLADSEN